jgi:hypothetical protein
MPYPFLFLHPWWRHSIEVYRTHFTLRIRNCDRTKTRIEKCDNIFLMMSTLLAPLLAMHQHIRRRILSCLYPSCITSSINISEKRVSTCTLTKQSIFQKPHSWTYNFVEVPGHNLESSQIWSFCMDFLNHRELRYGFLSGFPPFSFSIVHYLDCRTVRGCLSFKK